MIGESNKDLDHWNECYLAHFNKHLGSPSWVRSFEQNKQTPSIHIVSYEDVFGGCKAFCSIGFSAYKDIVGEHAEIFMPVDSGWDETPQILASVLFYIIQASKKIGWGLSIRFKDVFPDFVKTFGKSAIYFTIPYDIPENFNKVECNSIPGYIYLACYISEAEHQFFVKEGAEKFDDLLEKNNVDMFNISRPSIIEGD